MNIGLGSFIQPLQEIRAAYDHFARALDCELDIGVRGESPDSDDQIYVATQIDKALGHQYRAFFDVCDFLGVTIRERVYKLLSDFSATDINSAMPNYYSEIRPRLEKAGKDIANYRKDKDIGGEVDSLIDSAEDYDKVLEQMMNDLDIIESSIKTCVDFQNARLEKKTEEDKRANRSIAFGFAGAILGALVTYLVAK